MPKAASGLDLGGMAVMMAVRNGGGGLREAASDDKEPSIGEEGGRRGAEGVSASHEVGGCKSRNIPGKT